MTDAEILTQFAREHHTLNQISPQRAGRQLTIITDFQRWLGHSVLAVEADELRAWMAWQIEQGAKASTVRWKLMAVRPFLRWARERGHLDLARWIELNEVPPPRGSAQHVPRPYSRKELDAFYAAVSATFRFQRSDIIERYTRGTSPFKRVRNHALRLQIEAIVALALLQGMRADEIHVASLEELHPDNDYITVHAKRVNQNPKHRDVPYHPDARAAVSDWFTFRRLLGPYHDFTWLALAYDRRWRLTPMSRGSFAHLLAQVPGGWELHRFRHTCGTERLRAGMAIEVLQRFLGHANIQQTLAYAELVREDVQRAARKTDKAFARRVGRRAA